MEHISYWFEKHRNLIEVIKFAWLKSHHICQTKGIRNGIKPKISRKKQSIIVQFRAQKQLIATKYREEPCKHCKTNRLSIKLILNEYLYVNLVFSSIVCPQIFQSYSSFDTRIYYSLMIYKQKITNLH